MWGSQAEFDGRKIIEKKKFIAGINHRTHEMLSSVIFLFIMMIDRLIPGDGRIKGITAFRSREVIVNHMRYRMCKLTEISLFVYLSSRNEMIKQQKMVISERLDTLDLLTAFAKHLNRHFNG